MCRVAGIALLVLLGQLVTATVSAQEPTYRVVDLEVVGNRIATTSLILGVSSVQKGVTLPSMTAPMPPDPSVDTIR